MLDQSVDDLDKGKTLDSRWFTEDKDTEAKERLEQTLRNSTLQFRLLKKILEEIFNEKRFKYADLDKPNLEDRYIYLEGYRRALQDIYRILP